jgi:hypothetical protein
MKMDDEQILEKSVERAKDIAQALEDLAGSVADGDCNDPNTNLFDADAFWVEFNNNVRPLIKSVVDNQKMD